MPRNTYNRAYNMDLHYLSESVIILFVSVIIDQCRAVTIT